MRIIASGTKVASRYSFVSHSETMKYRCFARFFKLFAKKHVLLEYNMVYLICNIFKVFIARQYPLKIKYAETRKSYSSCISEILHPARYFFAVCIFYARALTNDLGMMII